jgi:hypothetical protein
VGKLIITREILALQAERLALERLEQKPEELPALVKRFWFQEESIIPPWRLESAEEEEERHQAERRGAWTG